MIDAFKRKFTVTFLDQMSCYDFFAEICNRYRCKTEMISAHDVVIIETCTFLQDIWDCICSDEVDSPDALVNIKVEIVDELRTTES